MKQKKVFTRLQKREIAEEYINNDVSLHDLGKKYGVSYNCIWRWYRIFGKGKKTPNFMSKEKPKQEKVPAVNLEISKLEEEIRTLRLKLEAQDIMLDIVKEQTGFDARKKAGAKQ